MDDFFKQVRLAYKSTGSMQRTAQMLGVTHPAVRKALITMGLYANDTSRKIAALLSDGKSKKEIMDALGISEAQYWNNSPHSKGTYLDDIKTENALKIAKSRAKDDAPDHDLEREWEKENVIQMNFKVNRYKDPDIFDALKTAKCKTDLIKSLMRIGLANNGGTNDAGAAVAIDNIKSKED